eukprot:8543455-Lingulodinium_polyedra.AAC.1
MSSQHAALTSTARPGGAVCTVGSGPTASAWPRRSRKPPSRRCRGGSRCCLLPLRLAWTRVDRRLDRG